MLLKGQIFFFWQKGLEKWNATYFELHKRVSLYFERAETNRFQWFNVSFGARHKRFRVVSSVYYSLFLIWKFGFIGCFHFLTFHKNFQLRNWIYTCRNSKIMTNLMLILMLLSVEHDKDYLKLLVAFNKAVVWLDKTGNYSVKILGNVSKS